jgi:hypothetical protein
MFFENENAVNGGETPTSNKQTINFSKIDTGDFLFWDFNESPVFIGTFKSYWKEDENKVVNGLEFIQHETGQRYILSEQYKLLDFFHYNKHEGFNYEKGIFRIEYKGKKELSGGKSIALFEFGYYLPE